MKAAPQVVELPLDRAAEEWLAEIQALARWSDRARARLALGATLHALRDQLDPAMLERVALGLPPAVGKLWSDCGPARRPARARSVEGLLALVSREYVHADVERAMRAVLRVLRSRLSHQCADALRAALPDPRELWPTPGPAS